MKEPLALIVAAETADAPQEPVAALLEAGRFEAAVAALWEMATQLIRGRLNLSIPTLTAWIDLLPAPWRADPRVRYLRSWVLFDQRRTVMALLELEELAAVWGAKLNGPECAAARQWLVRVRMAQGMVYEAEGRRERARTAFRDVFGWIADQETPAGSGTLELDPREAERLTALDQTGLTPLVVSILHRYQASGDRAGLAGAAHSLGNQYLDIGEPAQARFWLEHALDMQRGQPGEFPLLCTLDSLGRCYQQLGLLDEAQTALDEALRIAARLGSVSIQASSLSCLGDVYRDRDQTSSALEVYHRALALREKLRDPGGTAETHLSVGTLYRRSRHAGLAADCAAEARMISQSHRGPVLQATAALHQAIAGVLLGESRAGEAVAGAVDLLAAHCAPAEGLLGRWYLAVAAWKQNRPDEAARHLHQALAMAAQYRLMHLLAMELPATAGVCAAALSHGASAESLAGLVQRASAGGLLALLQAVPEAKGVVAAAGRLPEATALSVQLLGTFKVVRAGCEIDLGAARSQKAVSLFKFLVAQRGRAVAREQILDAIWPEADPESADRSFEVTLSTLRRLLDPPQGVTLIVRRGRGYMLNPDVPLLLDVERFRNHLERGNWWRHRGQAALAVAEWELAEAAYGGDFLADDPYEDWATADRERLREQYLDLVLRLGEVALDEGRPADAVERAQRVLIADPIREAAYRLLMRAHARQGNRAIAMRDLQRCSEMLRRELGEEPMLETRELARRIRTGEVQ